MSLTILLATKFGVQFTGVTQPIVALKPVQDISIHFVRSEQNEKRKLNNKHNYSSTTFSLTISLLLVDLFSYDQLGLDRKCCHVSATWTLTVTAARHLLFLKRMRPEDLADF